MEGEQTLDQIIETTKGDKYQGSNNNNNNNNRNPRRRRDKNQGTWEHDMWEDDRRRTFGGGRKFNQNRPNQKGFGGFSNNRANEKCRLKITNLHYSISEQDLNTIFSKFGELKKCKIDWDESGRSNESAIVEFFKASDAQQAMDEYNGKELDSLVLNIEFAPFNMPKVTKRITKHDNYQNNYNNVRGQGGQGGFRNRRFNR